MKYIYIAVILIVVLTACSPVATATSTLATTSTETPPTFRTPISSTPTPSSTSTPDFIATLGTYPTLPSGPTSTALPTLPPGRSLTLASIHMIDAQNGWGIDASEHIVHTTDGGNTWKDVTPHGGGYQNSGLFALDAKTAWATPYWEPCFDLDVKKCAEVEHGRAPVWYTSDGGNTWQEEHVCLWLFPDCQFNFDIPPAYYQPIAIRFLDNHTGWLLVTVAHIMSQDRYILFQTQDGGVHWSLVTDSALGPGTMSTTGLAFQDKQIGWMSLNNSGGTMDQFEGWGIYQSTDAGTTWDELPLPVPNPLPKTPANSTVECGGAGVVVVPPNAVGVTIECTVYTNPLSFYDFYFYSTDSGKHWISWRKTGDVEFLDPLTGWRSALDNGTYEIEQTRDGGQTWTKLKSVKWNGILDFINEQTGWAVATSDNVTSLVHTADGGKTWEEMKPVVGQ